MKIVFEWEVLNGCKAFWTFRAKVIGGWIMQSEQGHFTFIPDPEHKWEIVKRKI
jgi:hypothetical protein